MFFPVADLVELDDYEICGDLIKYLYIECHRSSDKKTSSFTVNTDIEIARKHYPRGTCSPPAYYKALTPVAFCPDKYHSPFFDTEKEAEDFLISLIAKINGGN